MAGTRCATNADCRLTDWQVNEVKIFVKCSNRFRIPKLNFQKTQSLVIGNLLKHFTTMFTSFTCQYASLQSAFVAHRLPPYVRLGAAMMHVSEIVMNRMYGM